LCVLVKEYSARSEYWVCLESVRMPYRHQFAMPAERLLQADRGRISRKRLLAENLAAARQLEAAAQGGFGQEWFAFTERQSIKS
jgi:hypothetical protein